MMPSICLTAFLLAQIPHVELDFDSMIAKDWKGKRFAQIIPADAIKRLVRLRESGFARDVWNQQADYDALIAYLMESKETARDWALGGDEGTRRNLSCSRKTTSSSRSKSSSQGLHHARFSFMERAQPPVST
jgi:hypothetical protein